MKKVFLCSLVVLAVSCLSATAQRRLIVADVETLYPISRVSVVGGSSVTQTDSLGGFVVDDSCRTCVFSHVNYESRIVNLSEVRDTVFLISKLLSMKEVVVFGKPREDDRLKELNRRLRLREDEMALLNANPNSGVNLLSLFGYLIPKKWRKAGKKDRKKRHQEMLDDY